MAGAGKKSGRDEKEPELLEVQSLGERLTEEPPVPAPAPVVTQADLAAKTDADLQALLQEVDASKDQTEAAKTEIRRRIRLETIDQETKVAATEKAAASAPPPAIPTGVQSGYRVAVAKKTTTKFIGTQWWNLTKGKTITAPENVIDSLRSSGFVE
jgi:hypothetical protein